MKRKLFIPLALALMMGCAGPRAPLAIAIKEVPSDVVLGSKKRPEPTLVPIPPTALPLDTRTISVFGPSLPDRQPSSFSNALETLYCPAASPLAVPEKPAVNTFSLPAAPGRYDFRNDGSFEISGANAKKGIFPVASAREVRNVRRVVTPASPEVRYQFEVSASLGELVTTTTYTLVPEQTTAPPTQGLLPDPQDASGSAAGLFITRVQTVFPDGDSEDFTPANSPGLLLLPFPISPGVTWDSAGGDPGSGMAMAFSGAIGQKARVDACGTVLDAWSVAINGEFGASEGTGLTISPTSRTSFVASYIFGTQYGGLSLMDTVEMERTAGGGVLRQKNHGTINSEPPGPEQNPPTCEIQCE